MHTHTYVTHQATPKPQQILTLVRTLGLAAAYLPSSGEFRIDFRRDDPRWQPAGQTAYSTDDPRDVLQAARLMTR